MLEIVVSREDANSESALLVEWLADDGEEVRKGQPVCVIETSKSAIEIEAPGHGTLCRLVDEGEEVPLGERIALVADGAGEVAEAEALRKQARRPVAPVPAEGARATRKAVELAAAHGIDLSEISKPGFITAEDVEALIAERAAGAAGGAGGGLLAGISLEHVSLPDSLGGDAGEGVLDEELLRRLQTEPERIRALPAEERLELYRAGGASIGEGVRLGARTLLVAPRIVLEDGVALGDDSTFECTEVLCIGAGTLFRNRVRAFCRRVFIGREGYFSELVHIGGGGSSEPQAVLAIGDLAYVGAETFINPCRPILIGREVFVTMRSVLVTHNVGHSLLEGFENRFAPIVLEDRSQVGIGAVVYAGCRIGREAIVGSNSYVVSDVPAGKMAIGVPARVAGSASHPPSRGRQVELARRALSELHEHLVLAGRDVELLADGRDGFLVRTDGATSEVRFVERLDSSGYGGSAADGERIMLTLELLDPPPDGVAVLELLERRAQGPGGVVYDTVREFWRKRGVRFAPGPWRYHGGLL